MEYYPIPKFELFPKLAKVGQFVMRIVRQLPETGYYSSHVNEPEDTLATPPQLFTYDSEGCYYDGPRTD